MFYKKTVAPFIVLTLILTMAFPVFALSQNEAAKLQRGEIISRTLSSQQNGLKGVEAKIYINAPKEAVWDMLNDQEKLMKIIPSIKKVKVLEKTDNYQKVESAMKVCPFLPLFKYTVLMDQSDKYRRIKFRKVDGCFKQLYGEWELEPVGNGTVLTYRMFINPGFFVPSSVASSSLKDVLPNVMSNLKANAERR